MATEENMQQRFDAREVLAESNVSTVELTGQLDAHTAPTFEKFLEERVRQEKKHNLVLDFGRLDYISSAGLGVLMGLIEEVRSTGGDIKLANVPEKIYHVLDLLGFPVVFQIYPTAAEAAASFSAKA